MNPADWARARLAICSVLIAAGLGSLEATVGFVVAKRDCREAGMDEGEIRNVIDLALERLHERA